MTTLELSFSPLTPDRFSDFEKLFGVRGACAGCWCMFWKLSAADFKQAGADAMHQMQHSLVDSGVVPGLLAYHNDVPVGWVAVEPRGAYPRLGRSRLLKPIDDAEVWSVTCFFVAKAYRRKGLSARLLRAAVEHVRELGGRIVEGYPTQPSALTADAFVYMGTAGAFAAAGFEEVARPSEKRRIFRYVIHP